MIKFLKALIVLIFITSAALAQEVPKGVKVVASPEVMPTLSELVKDIPLSLKKLGKGKTMRVMFQLGLDAAAPIELKETIEKETGLSLKIDVIPPESLHERQLAFFKSGSAEYDLLEIYPAWIGEYAEEEYIENLDSLYKQYTDEIDAGDFIEGAQNGFGKYKGSWYAIPYDGDVNIFYYRKDLFDDAKNKADFKKKYGYTLEPPKTWEQVRDMAEFFTGRQSGLYGFGTLTFKTWWAVDYWANIYRNRLIADGIKFENGLVNDNGEIELNKEAFVKANDFYIDLLKFSPPGILSWGYSESKEGLCNGTLVMAIQWASSVFRDPRQAKYWDKIYATTMPGFKKKDRGLSPVTSLALGKAMVIPSGRKNKDLAFLYAHFITSTIMQIYETNSGSGVDPNRYSVWKDKRVKDIWGPLIEPTIKSLQIGIGAIKVPQSQKLYESILNELYESWSGEQTSIEALDKIMKQWETILSE